MLAIFMPPSGLCFFADSKSCGALTAWFIMGRRIIQATDNNSKQVFCSDPEMLFSGQPGGASRGQNVSKVYSVKVYNFIFNMGLEEIFLQPILFGWLFKLSSEGYEPFAILGLEQPLSTDNILAGWEWGFEAFTILVTNGRNSNICVLDLK